MRGLLIPLVCALLLAACAPVLADPGHRAHISSLPNGVELSDGASILDVQILEDRVVRVYVRPHGKQTPPTPVLDPEPRWLAPSAVARREEDGAYTLSTPEFSVRVDESQPHRIAFLDSAGKQLLEEDDPIAEDADSSIIMRHAAGETFYGIHGLGRDDTTHGLERNQGGAVAAGVQGDSGAPFIFTVRYGLLVDSDGGEFTTAAGTFSFRHSSRPDVDYYVFIGPPLLTMGALARATGPPPLPPKWTLGFLNSQWGATQAEIEQAAARYRQERLPIDGFLLDFDWKAWGEDNYGEWRWNSTSGAGNVSPDKFPQGADGDFARKLAAEGIHLGGILKPRILTTVAGDPHQPTIAAAYATAHRFWYPDDASEDYFSHRMARDLDFNIPAERRWFWEHLLPAFQAGMAAWWNDEADISGSRQVFNNFQFLNMGRMLYDGQRSATNLRVWSLNRNFYLGASRYGYAGWSGDIQSGFDSMALQRRRMLAALDTGEFHWSMDTGGYFGHPTPENYARWLEFAAFVPIMRVHGELNEKRQPWVYGPVAEAAARKALDLRYALLPYMYSYERLNSEGHAGLVRPLFWEFPSDPACATEDAEWMFGDALLVSPVVAEGATSQQVYLPAGEWFNYATGKRYEGARTISLAIDAKSWADIPLFVRSGSILATQPVEQYVSQRRLTALTLDVFPAQSGARFTAYDDDGATYRYEKGSYLRQQIDAQRTGQTIQITIDPATGTYASPLRSYLLRIHSTASRVVFNGKPLAASHTARAPALRGAGWSLTRDRFGPVVLLRVPAGEKIRTIVRLN